MSNFEGVKAAVERWMGRVGSDASAHVDKPTVVTVTLHPTEQPVVEVAHVDGSDEEKPAAGSRQQYGTPVHPEGVTPFGSTGLAGREWAGTGPEVTPDAQQRSADVQPAEQVPVNETVVSDGAHTPVV
jgi:hypothetical protein